MKTRVGVGAKWGFAQSGGGRCEVGVSGAKWRWAARSGGQRDVGGPREVGWAMQSGGGPCEVGWAAQSGGGGFKVNHVVPLLPIWEFIKGLLREHVPKAEVWFR